MTLKINRLQHVGIPVTNIVISAAFYERLGFANVMDSEFDHHKEKGKVIMMQLDDIIIELYQLPGKALEEISNRTNGHIDHIAFDVADIEETFILLREASFEIVEAAPVFLPFWKKGCRYFNILGPDGERLEFNQIIS